MKRAEDDQAYIRNRADKGRAKAGDTGGGTKNMAGKTFTAPKPQSHTMSHGPEDFLSNRIAPATKGGSKGTFGSDKGAFLGNPIAGKKPQKDSPKDSK